MTSRDESVKLRRFAPANCQIHEIRLADSERPLWLSWSTINENSQS